jgi:hypothetical protein
VQETQTYLFNLTINNRVLQFNDFREWQRLLHNLKKNPIVQYIIISIDKYVAFNDLIGLIAGSMVF